MPLPLPDANIDRPVPPAEGRPVWVVPCPDLDEAIQRLSRAGFVLLALGPADEPSWAMMSHGHERYAATLRLDSTAHRAGRQDPYLEFEEDALGVEVVGGPPPAFLPPPSLPQTSAENGDDPDDHRRSTTPSLPVDADAPEQWITGRAGMRYRDLLPGRWGGDFIASHIHIPSGGPVPDYVHYHHVDFQLIFCHRGWVRVVYQDQGDPFVLNPGDAILQAPGIRHRVLEASDHLHVIEVSSPAEHATFVEHDLELPNGNDDGQSYGGQHYVHHRADEVPVEPWLPGIGRQSFGLQAATDGRYSASVIRLDGDDTTVLPLPLAADVDFELVTAVDGRLTISDAATGQQTILNAGAATALDSSCSWTAWSQGPAGILTVSRHRI